MAFSQTRDEIVKRYESGEKNIVITYSGVGNAEKIIKISEYNEGYLFPYLVTTWGPKKDTDGREIWTRIKEEYFKKGGHFFDKVYNL
jgi:hypothetical protein